MQLQQQAADVVNLQAGCSCGSTSRGRSSRGSRAGKNTRLAGGITITTNSGRDTQLLASYSVHLVSLQ